MGDRRVSLFLMRHAGEVEAANVTADGMTIRLKPFVDQVRATLLLADLINMVQPKRGLMTAPDTIRLEF